ncbi:MAG: pilus assembly protein PilP [Bdellovibrionales bacterium]|nr:pilus assembly protein PilP [Bdellovibrionales bacterium]
MVRLLVGLVMVGLLAYIAYHQVSTAPLDARATIEASVEQISGQTDLKPGQTELLRVQLAISDFQAANARPPATLEELVPKYFDRVPRDPNTNEPFAYERDGMAFRLGAQTQEPVRVASAAGGSTPSAAELDAAVEGYVNPNTMELEDFTYDPAGRRDPFLPFNFAPGEQVDMSKPPLERYSLGQLKVTAVLQDTDGDSTAIVEDATGRGYTVRPGARLGNRNGVVVSIQPEGVNVVETTVDFTGKETKHATFMKLQVKPNDDGLPFNMGGR